MVFVSFLCYLTNRTLTALVICKYKFEEICYLYVRSNVINGKENWLYYLHIAKDNESRFINRKRNFMQFTNRITVLRILSLADSSMILHRRSRTPALF